MEGLLFYYLAFKLRMMIKIVMSILVVLGCLSCCKESEGICEPGKLVSLTIEEVIVKKFSNRKANGDEWDESFLESEYPADLVVSVSSGAELIGMTQIYKPNVTSPSHVSFSTSYLITNVDLILTISIWDKDDVENEFIGSVIGIPRDVYRNSDCLRTYSFIQNEMEIDMIATYTEVK